MTKSRYMALLATSIAGIFLIIFLWLGLEQHNGGRVVRSALLGTELPSFRVENLYRKDEWITENFLRGEVFGINFFASWCVPCRAEHPLLAKLDIPLIGIAWKDKDSDIKNFIEELGMVYKVIGTDEGGSAMINYGIVGIPETLIVDKQGVIIYHQQGVLTPRSLVEEISPLLDSVRNE